ncbi:MAG: tautomerase family protein [Pseudomonadota bacterium]
MPIVEAHILEGYSSQDKARLSSALTDAVRLVVPAPDEAITVLLREYASEDYARGGSRRTPAPASPDPKGVVLGYLDAMAARDTETASGFLSVGFEMRFPGSGPMTRLQELIAWSKDRYRFVTKTNEAVEAFQSGRTTCVFVRGTLAGTWPDGTVFDGIRFVDRFEIEDGLITRQDVWNDLAETRAQ